VRSILVRERADGTHFDDTLHLQRGCGLLGAPPEQAARANCGTGLRLAPYSNGRWTFFIASVRIYDVRTPANTTAPLPRRTLCGVYPVARTTYVNCSRTHTLFYLLPPHHLFRF